MRSQVLSDGSEDEDVEETQEGTNVRELDDRYDGSLGENGRRGAVCRPGSLSVMTLRDWIGIDDKERRER